MNALLSPIYGLLANSQPDSYNAFMSLAEWDFLEGKRLPWPVPWHVLFKRPAPLLVEIGFGNGQFLLDLAARQEDADLVGLEISQPSLRNTQRKTLARQLPNVRLVHTGAEQGLWTLFAPRAISAVYINFPDPWPKARQHNRRLIDVSFLTLLASRMHEGAALEVATDDGDYAREIASHLLSCSHFENRHNGPLAAPYAHEDETRVRTKYELIARAEGRRCYYFKWRRNVSPAAYAYPLPRELDMPHLILEQSPTLNQIVATFEPASHTGEWGTIRFIGLFEARDYRALLVDTFVDEQALTQRLGLAIRARSDDTLIIGLHEIGFPRATPGVHRAIQQLCDDLRQRHPQLRVASSNLIT